MISLVLWLIILVGCKEKDAPIEIRANSDRIEITATADQVTVEKIVINRGHCRGIFVDTSGPSKFYMQDIKNMKSHTFNFGEKMLISVDCSVKEAEITTNAGSYTFNFE